MNALANIPDTTTVLQNGPGSALLEVIEVYKAFGSLKVLDGFSMKLFSGENVAIVGKSGSGKSVLLKCIIGLLPYDSGIIRVLGQDVSQLDQRQLDRLRTEIGFLFQGSALYDSMTVRENLQFPLRRHMDKMQNQVEEELIRETLASVGLEHTIDLWPEELSGGMQRRIALARTLILRPQIILYDEPTTGLDPITSREIIELILDIQKQYGTASLIITHDMQCVRLASDRMVILHEGKNYATGSYGDLKKRNDPIIQAFLETS
ncbi:MAG: ATP-binding cassette domain-containing protein [Lewinellaceae bacterium]|nr:ATP-binding cassette domain-containing protein [Lewinellaceae bacterium]HPR01721.1 ATP-binding cassette domain-containing protein [Saprospiraceae bacterium]